MADTNTCTLERITRRDLSTIFSRRERVVEKKGGFTVYLKPVNTSDDPEYFRRDSIHFEPVGEEYAVEYHIEYAYRLTDKNGILFWEWVRRFEPIERMVSSAEKVINFALQVGELLWLVDYWRTGNKRGDQQWREYVIDKATEKNAKKKFKLKSTNPSKRK